MVVRVERAPAALRAPSITHQFKHVGAEARRQVAAENGRVARSTRNPAHRSGSFPHQLLITAYPTPRRVPFPPSRVPILDRTKYFSDRRHQIIRRKVQIARRQVRMAGRRLSIARRRVHFANLAGRMADITGQISSRKIHFSDGVSYSWIGRDISPISQRGSCHSITHHSSGCPCSQSGHVSVGFSRT